eukprot:479801-Rhodomonas_salina.1
MEALISHLITSIRGSGGGAQDPLLPDAEELASLRRDVRRKVYLRPHPAPAANVKPHDHAANDVRALFKKAGQAGGEGKGLSQRIALGRGTDNVYGGTAIAWYWRRAGCYGGAGTERSMVVLNWGTLVLFWGTLVLNWGMLVRSGPWSCTRSSSAASPPSSSPLVRAPAYGCDAAIFGCKAAIHGR